MALVTAVIGGLVGGALAFLGTATRLKRGGGERLDRRAAPAVPAYVPSPVAAEDAAEDLEERNALALGPAAEDELRPLVLLGDVPPEWEPPELEETLPPASAVRALPLRAKPNAPPPPEPPIVFRGRRLPEVSTGGAAGGFVPPGYGTAPRQPEPVSVPVGVNFDDGL